MSFFVKINDDIKIELPTDLELSDRIKLCEEILEQYPEYFRYVLPQNNKSQNTAGNHVSMRLEIMGTYLLDATKKDKQCPILSQYKEKMIKNNEISMSDLEKSYKK